MRAWPESEVVIATHVDAAHIHSHFIINAVCFATGKMLRQHPNTLQRLRTLSDELCMAHGLSVLAKGQKRSDKVSAREYRSAARGQSWKFRLMNTIDECMRYAKTRGEFVALMRKEGYEVKWSDTGVSGPESRKTSKFLGKTQNFRGKSWIYGAYRKAEKEAWQLKKRRSHGRKKIFKKEEIHMRNLKRALSLMLASVMLLGMMVVGAGAAQSYPDVDDSYNTEAIDVLKTVNVMTGYAEDGNFHPDDTVNRAMMARIMAELMNLDYDYYEAIPSQFTDVTGNYSWAKKYVDACAANGIVVGRGAGIYDPAAGVTAVEAASMMMRALGYFQHSGDYNGGFEAATVSQASRISLFSGINGNANDALNRNQVAKLALNTLEANMVDFTGDMGFEYNGLSVGYRSEYSIRKGTDSKYAAISNQGDATDLKGDGAQGQYYVQLGEQLYGGNLQKVSDFDGFGAPANTWSYKNTKIGTYNKTPDYVLEGKVKSNAMYDTVGADVAKNYEWFVYVDGADDWYDDSGDETLYIFGSNENDLDDIRKQVADNNNDDLVGTGRGTVTSVYLSNDTSDAKRFHGTAIVTVVNTYAGEVAQVETKDGVTTVTVSDMDAGTDLSFEAVGCEEDDVVLYSKYQENYGDGKWSAGKILGLAGHVQGEATTIRNEEHVVVDGDTYYYNVKFNEAGGLKLGVASVGYEVAFYIDFQDNIVMIDSAVESYDYAVVADVGYAPNQYADKTTFGATLVLSDGTVKEVILDNDTTDAILKAAAAESLMVYARANILDEVNMTEEEAVDALKTALVGRVFAYRENDNGRFTLSPAKNKETGDDANKSALLYYEDEEQVKDIVKSGSSQVKKPNKEDGKFTGEYLYANSNTVFMIHAYGDDADEFSVYVGYSKLPQVNSIKPVPVGEGEVEICTSLSYYQDPNRAAAGVIVITDAEVSGSIDDVIFLVGDTDPEVQQTGSEKYYVYDAVVNGEPTELEILTVSKAAEEASKIEKGQVGVYYGMTTDKNGRVKDLTLKEPETAAVNGKALANPYTADKLKDWTGFKRTSDEVMSFGYDKDKNKYERTVAASDKMTIARRNTDGTIEKLSALPTDTNDQAVVVTDAGRAVAIFIWAYDQGVDPTESGSAAEAGKLTIVNETGSTVTSKPAAGTAVTNGMEIEVTVEEGYKAEATEGVEKPTVKGNVYTFKAKADAETTGVTITITAKADNSIEMTWLPGTGEDAALITAKNESVTEATAEVRAGGASLVFTIEAPEYVAEGATAEIDAVVLADGYEVGKLSDGALITSNEIRASAVSGGSARLTISSEEILAESVISLEDVEITYSDIIIKYVDADDETIEIDMHEDAATSMSTDPTSTANPVISYDSAKWTDNDGDTAGVSFTLTGVEYATVTLEDLKADGTSKLFNAAPDGDASSYGYANGYEYVTLAIEGLEEAPEKFKISFATTGADAVGDITDAGVEVSNFGATGYKDTLKLEADPNAIGSAVEPTDVALKATITVAGDDGKFIGQDGAYGYKVAVTINNTEYFGYATTTATPVYLLSASGETISLSDNVTIKKGDIVVTPIEKVDVKLATWSGRTVTIEFNMAIDHSKLTDSGLYDQVTVTAGALEGGNPTVKKITVTKESETTIKVLVDQDIAGCFPAGESSKAALKIQIAANALVSADLADNKHSAAITLTAIATGVPDDAIDLETIYNADAVEE